MGKQVIVKAAIMYSNGEVLEGRDYGHINYLGHKLSLPDTERIQGFVTNTGEFVLPDQAAIIAVEAHQIKEAPAVLNPDNLWRIQEMD